MIRSDGHTIEFIYGVRHPSSEGLPDLTMSDTSDLSDLPTDLQNVHRGRFLSSGNVNM
jgi:hypothetical protein